MELLFDGPEGASHLFVFAHGAGGPMRSAFMNTIARGLAANGIRVARFEFPYVRERRKTPDREPALREAWTAVIEELGGLATLETPALIVQGRRDPFGSPEDVAGCQLSEAIRIAWIEGGDHSFKPRPGLGRSERENLDQAIRFAADFIQDT